uniref:Uncharacterized protein n=1 Tax=Odontella aurita TaxID=265563 RepID=A0A7S4KBT7_9STRA|mmetsp:Transcript_8994/g.26877  ORF Transcript_8994/g.26877 Transcript_8994/m.26877 type:complete len:140 (+) Transcript_8994:66-485(+)
MLVQVPNSVVSSIKSVAWSIALENMAVVHSVKYTSLWGVGCVQHIFHSYRYHYNVFGVMTVVRSMGDSMIVMAQRVVCTTTIFELSLVQTTAAYLSRKDSLDTVPTRSHQFPPSSFFAPLIAPGKVLMNAAAKARNLST